ncbi:uncharacterized protein Z520_08863 [Fonsecaea multimorphosa CBS 102226]|uniref:BHLH domain-containing protein n=1 Tax=Fonsecaea multimorphosa CBS 102226 TaxID=1442371 RepID=A0A0D2IDY3_9EURO|nr:uncharacterized protein Z520_08863 [Fonsecaea multimorphosa CBS 102226]KIX95346.1 hypothetical protein Z520_08863 [Fonsecaea multimorphosa CBS 102226]OAL21142.1 hypothetical protein AYO22_08299 [Fonsecaea multimorphosa]
MPFRQLFHQQDGSPDFHGQHAFQTSHPQLAMVDPDSIDFTGWHEMDFTTAPLTTTTSSRGTLLNQKYSTAMDRDQDPLAYLRSSNHRQGSTGSLITSSSHQQSPEPRRSSGDMYSNTQYSYSQLLNMEANLPPMDQSSLTSSRADDDATMLNNDNSLTTTLSASESLNPSRSITNLDPIAASIASKTDSTEKLCPLIAGQVDSCQPQRCGPDAPCMNFTTLPPIEECTSVPCITGSTSSPSETMISNDGMSVELHQRPSMSARTSTTATSRSATTRRSSNSTTATTAEPDTVPLPPRRTSATAAARRQNRTSPPTMTTAASMASDDEDEEQPTTAKSTAPSKADAKQRAKQAHSLVERKYRENLNAKISQLHNTLQASHYGPKVGEDGEIEAAANNSASGLPPPKVRKSDVLTEAMNYVNQTEVEMRHMENEIHRLTERVRVLEKLVRCEDCSLLKQMVNLQVQAV